jgi:eukaryotic-like serine/threonine-protein kinase
MADAPSQPSLQPSAGQPAGGSTSVRRDSDGREGTLERLPSAITGPGESAVIAGEERAPSVASAPTSGPPLEAPYRLRAPSSVRALAAPPPPSRRQLGSASGILTVDPIGPAAARDLRSTGPASEAKPSPRAASEHPSPKDGSFLEEVTVLGNTPIRDATVIRDASGAELSSASNSGAEQAATVRPATVRHATADATLESAGIAAIPIKPPTAIADSEAGAKTTMALVEPTPMHADVTTAEELPRQFGKYTLLRKLATGGMAELFLALQQSMAGFEKLIVVKRILPKMNQDAGFIEMLLNEARVAASMSHPNIVQTFDVGEVDGVYYIAMEHVQGEDIRAVVRQLKKVNRNEFPLEHAVEIIRGLCSGLSYAHERCDLEGVPLRIVHRDISPQNVVITFSGDVKVVDFGIAQSDKNLATETGFGKLKGKIPYMSPEQARGLELDSRSDIFSAGVMLFELTTGRRLFKGDSEYSTLKLICESTYPLPSQIRSDYPPALEAIVLRALAKDRTERYQTARELQSALESFSREQRVATSSVALSAFMRDIFSAELAAGRDAVLSDKKLAAGVLKLKASSTSDWPVWHPRSAPPSMASLPSLPASATGEYPVPPSSAAQVPNLGAAVALPQISGLGPLPTAAATTAPIEIAAGATTSAAATAKPAMRRTGLWGATGVCLIALAGGAIWRATIHARPQSATDVPAAPVVAPNVALVRIESTPPGATIWIDGNMHSATTPTTLDAIPIDREVKIRLSKDGYDAAESTLKLSANDLTTTRLFVLERGSFTITWSVEPKSATVSIDDISAEGSRATDLAADVDHVLVIAAPGFQEERIVVRGESHAVKNIALQLHRAQSTGTATVGSGAFVASTSGARPPVQDPNATTTSAAISGAKGTLNVGASGGWCNVAVDGVARGPTPVAGIELSSGKHSVTCTTIEGKAQSASVVVTAGGVARQKFTL